MVESIPPAHSNLRDQATLVIEYFQDQRLALYNCPPLKRDLQRLRIEEKSYGVRLTSPRDSEGHGDTFSALLAGVVHRPRAIAQAPTVVGTGGTPFQTPMKRTAEELQFREDDEREDRAVFAAYDRFGGSVPLERLRELYRAAR